MWCRHGSTPIGYGWFNQGLPICRMDTAGCKLTVVLTLWYYYYDIIKQANIILSVIDQASGPVADRESIKGQALGLWAYLHYLINLFPAKPIKVTKANLRTYFTQNQALMVKPRGTVQNVLHDLILKDLTDAETLLATKPCQTKCISA